MLLCCRRFWHLWWRTKQQGAFQSGQAHHCAFSQHAGRASAPCIAPDISSPPAALAADILWSSRGSAATSGPSRGLAQSEMLRMDAAVLAGAAQPARAAGGGVGWPGPAASRLPEKTLPLHLPWFVARVVPSCPAQWPLFRDYFLLCTLPPAFPHPHPTTTTHTTLPQPQQSQPPSTRTIQPRAGAQPPGHQHRGAAPDDGGQHAV